MVRIYLLMRNIAHILLEMIKRNQSDFDSGEKLPLSDNDLYSEYEI